MAARKWTYEEIIERSDELAARFEAFDLDAAEEVPVAEYLLSRAVRQRASNERHVVEAVQAALEDGTSWNRIGQILGVTGQEAQTRYGHLVKPVELSSRERGGLNSGP